MNADTIQAYALVAVAIVAAVGLVVRAVIKEYVDIRAQLATLQADHGATAARLDNTVNAVEQAKSTIQTISLAMPAPGQQNVAVAVAPPADTGSVHDLDTPAKDTTDE